MPAGFSICDSSAVQDLAVEDLPGVGILVVLVLDPRIGIGDVAVEQVLAVFAVGFQIGLLDLVADELGIARRQLGLDEVEIALLQLLRELLAPDRLLQDVHEMHRVGRHLLGVVVERLRQHLEGKARRDARHALVHAGGIAVFLHRFRLGIDVLQVLAVIDAHLGVERRVLVLGEPRRHGEPAKDLQHLRRAGIARRARFRAAASRRSASPR